VQLRRCRELWNDASSVTQHGNSPSWGSHTLLWLCGESLLHVEIFHGFSICHGICLFLRHKWFCLLLAVLHNRSGLSGTYRHCSAAYCCCFMLVVVEDYGLLTLMAYNSTTVSPRPVVYIEEHTRTRLTALCPGLPGWAGTRKVKTNLAFTEARDNEWHWHQLGHMQVCVSLQSDNHTSPHHSVLLQAGCPSCRPTNSIKALKAI